MLIKVPLKISVAISGGVDSSVVLALLKDLGHKVRGVYYKRWSGQLSNVVAKHSNMVGDLSPDIQEQYLKEHLDGECPFKVDLEYIEKVSKQLGVSYEVYNFTREYKKQVLTDFFAKYKKGLTPNPDILCNSKIKFGLLLKKELEKGADILATGHYARLFKSQDRFSWENYNLQDLAFVDKNLKSYILQTAPQQLLLNAIDITKDQSYFLSEVDVHAFKHVTFPLGNMLKTQVRKLAEFYGLSTAKRKDSQGICFLVDVKVQDFIKQNLGVHRGKIRDIDTNKVVGTHQGVWLYTIGQRKGIKIGGAGTAYYVVKLDERENIVYVAKGRNNPHLQRSKISLNISNFLINTKSGINQLKTFNGYVAIRYRNKPILATVDIQSEKNIAIITALASKSSKVIDKQEGISVPNYFWAPAPGQQAVVYSQNMLLVRQKQQLETQQQSPKMVYKEMMKMLKSQALKRHKTSSMASLSMWTNVESNNLRAVILSGEIL